MENVERIGVRELRQHASRYLDRVKSGETVEVTERGRLVALLVPPEPAREARERLIADGRLIPASGALRLPQRVVVARTSEEILRELRDDR
jgi:prevent-host-death family protein